MIIALSTTKAKVNDYIISRTMSKN